MDEEHPAPEWLGLSQVGDPEPQLLTTCSPGPEPLSSWHLLATVGPAGCTLPQVKQQTCSVTL